MNAITLAPARASNPLQGTTSSSRTTSSLPGSARVCWFEELSLADIPRVGGKNASLGELTRAAAQLGIHVPPGFALPTAAFRWFMQEAGLAREIEKFIKSIRT